MLGVQRMVLRDTPSSRRNGVSGSDWSTKGMRMPAPGREKRAVYPSRGRPTLKLAGDRPKHRRAPNPKNWTGTRQLFLTLPVAFESLPFPDLPWCGRSWRVWARLELSLDVHGRGRAFLVCRASLPRVPAGGSVLGLAYRGLGS